MARPQYSIEIVAEILQHVTQQRVAWDCGTGSGQFTRLLAPHFQKVYATDLSAAQISHAPVLPNVEYRIAAAENSGLADQSVDLLTVAQAIHWFNFDAFYLEVKRVVKHGGLFAMLGYGLIEAKNSTLNQLFQQLYYQTLQGYWDAERRHIDEHYRTIPCPFTEIATTPLTLAYQWKGEQVLNYLSTWSGLQHYQKQHAQRVLILYNH